MAKILESCIVRKEHGKYLAWPTITKMPDGELLLVFSGDRDSHVCPYGKTILMRSKDNGGSWSEPAVVNNTALDDRDAGVCVCTDGTVLVSWFTVYADENRNWGKYSTDLREKWRAYVDRIPRTEVERWSRGWRYAGDCPRGHWIRRSMDGGVTWEDPVKVPPTAPHGPISLKDGRVLFVGNSGYDRQGKSTCLFAAHSPDSGNTWEVISRISMFPEHQAHCVPNSTIYLGEPHIVEAASGRIIGLVRFEEKPRDEARKPYLWQFTSEDGGYTWTGPYQTEIVGKPPHLTKLKDGRILATYGYRHEPYGQRACLSFDEWKTWDYKNEIVLRDDASNGDLGYPASAECDDGTILTVYYQIDKPGEKTCIMTTRWQVD